MEIICKTCKYPKDKSEYYKSKNKSGHESSCKKCSDLRHYEKRRERRLERGLTVKFPTLANRQLAEEGMKYCPGCKQVKSIIEDFSTIKVRNGIASHCKECNNRFGRERSSLPEYIEKRKTSYKRNREKQLNFNLLRKFGITLEQYNKQLTDQDGKCIICGKTPEENGKRLAVDHNHTTGKNRDLLCNNCNVTIGFIEKNRIDADKLKWYLERHNINR